MQLQRQLNTDHIAVTNILSRHTARCFFSSGLFLPLFFSELSLGRKYVVYADCKALCSNYLSTYFSNYLFSALINYLGILENGLQGQVESLIRLVLRR